MLGIKKNEIPKIIGTEANIHGTVSYSTIAATMNPHKTPRFLENCNMLPSRPRILKFFN